MADNVPITAGSGTNVATDDVSGVHYQRVKLVDGTLESSTAIAAGGGVESGALRVTIASDSTGVVSVDDNGSSITVDGTVAATQSGTWTLSANSGVDIGDVTINNASGASAVNIQDGGNTITVDGTVTVSDGLNIEGDIAHDGGDSGNPLKIGAKAIAHGTNPTAVAAADRTDLYANRAGVLFVIGGHPNVVSASVRIAAATGAQTDAAIAPGTIAAGTKIVITRLTVTCSNANTVNVAVKIGFGTSTIPADSTTGAAGIIIDHEGIPPGGGFTIGDGSGILAVGGDGEELRLTCDAPTGGFVIASYSYYTIES